MLFILLMVFVATAAGLAWYLIAHDRGEREPVIALWLAAGAGIAAAAAAGLIEARLIPASNLLPGAPHGTLLAASLGIGIIEEGCKFLPLALLLYGRRFFNEHTDGVIYFAIAGLGFGLPENILYTLQFGSRTGFLRVLLTPLFHAAITGMVGYYLARLKMTKKSPFLIIFPLIAAMLLHCMYDFGLASGIFLFGLLSIMITLLSSSALFLLFLKATEHDQDVGLSAVGHNNFCRSCGFPNPQHHLYCTHCGQRA